MIEDEIQEMVDRETRAWNEQNADALVSIFHPDMVWPWPKDENAHDPTDWTLQLGRYDRDRWKAEWQELFDTHTLVHNQRETVKIVVSEPGDGALAVVDVDTLWRNNHTNHESHWIGRASKGYTKVDGTWKLIMHTGLLNYDDL